MVPIHNNGDAEMPKGISRAIEEYDHAHSQISQCRWLWACCSKGRRETKEGYKIGHRSSKKPMKAYLYNDNLINKPPKLTNITSTDVTFGGAYSSRMVAKKQGCYFIEFSSRYTKLINGTPNLPPLSNS